MIPDHKTRVMITVDRVLLDELDGQARDLAQHRSALLEYLIDQKPIDPLLFRRWKKSRGGGRGADLDDAEALPLLPDH